MYPVYKLIRAVNRQYPNNGFISAVDVTEETNDGLIPEDFRDLLNETIQEIYHDIAIDEMFSFPTVPGQKEYALPEDCDLRDIQEVVRTFARKPYGPPPPPPPGPVPPEQRTCAVMFDANRGTGEMEPVVVNYGTQYVLPACTFTPPYGKEFAGWGVNGSEYAEPPIIYDVGEAIEINTDVTVSPVWQAIYCTVSVSVIPEGGTGILHYKPIGGEAQTETLTYGGTPFVFSVPMGKNISDVYEIFAIYDDTDTYLCEDLTGRTITEDTSIEVAVPIQTIPAEPIVDPDPEEPIEPSDPAEPVVEPDPEEPITPATPGEDPDPEEPIT